MRAAALVQIVLLGLFTAIGLVGTVAVAVDWLQGLETWFWQESTCTIESSTAVERPEYGDAVLQLSYRYSQQGREYAGNAYRHGYSGSETAAEAEVLASRFAVGDGVQCWVDPETPEDSYLLRSNLWDGFWIFAPLMFVAAGSGFLWLLYGPPSRGAEEENEGKESPASRFRPSLKVAAMILFPGVLFLLGAGFLIPFFIRPALEVVAARSWDEVPCDVVSSEVRSHPGDETTTYSVGVLFRYEIKRREYRSNRYQFMGGSSGGYERKARIVAALPPGSSTICFVDPDDPFEAVLERGFTPDYLFGMVPLVFVLIGIGGVAFVIFVLRGARKNAELASWTDTTGMVGSSSFGAVTETPLPLEEARRGPVVLEPTMGPFGKLGCAVVVALCWNGFISLFVWQVIESWREGRPEWFVIIVLSPFVLIGVLMLASVPHSILALLNPRPRVHLTPGALVAGESAQLEWAFRGLAGRIRSLKIWLEASETTIRQGDSSVSAEIKALDTPAILLLERGREMPLDNGGVSFTIPRDTPPTTVGDISIRWKLKLHGDIAYWPDVHQEFEVELVGGSRD